MIFLLPHFRLIVLYNFKKIKNKYYFIFKSLVCFLFNFSFQFLDYFTVLNKDLSILFTATLNDVTLYSYNSFRRLYF